MRKSNLVGLSLILLVCIAYTWATWQFFTRVVPGGNDFLTHYGGWEAYLQSGLNPYSDQAALHTQLAIYGRPALPGEDQNRMAYPFYSILLHGPFVSIQDYALARALYMTLEQAAVLGGVLLCLALVNWRPPGWLLVSVLGWSLLNYHTARGILIGQFALLAFFALAASLFLLRRRRDALAGVMLVVTMIKPPLVFLLVPFLLLWAFARRRWGLVAGFLGALTLLCAGSLLVLPTWIGDWLYRVTRYADYTFNQSPVWTLSAQATALIGPIGPIALVGLFVAGMLWAWQRVLRNNDGEFHWALGVTLVVTNLISPRTATTDYVLMLAPTVWFFAALDRAAGWGRAAVVAAMLVSFVGLWWLHIATVQDNWEQSVMYLPFPIALGLALIAARRWLVDDMKNLVSGSGIAHA